MGRIIWFVGRDLLLGSDNDLLDDEDLDEMSIRFLHAIENATSKQLASSSFAKLFQN